MGIGRKEVERTVDPVFEVVVHYHGGGFWAMSSNTHQISWRNWAKKVNIPIFSVDYRLAPEAPYPAGLEDCWNAYRWIVLYLERHLNMKPNKIILVGDSAGGNLWWAVTILAIQNNFRVPDNLILAYPALDLSTKRFYPSLLNGLTDLLLNFNLMRAFRDAYIQGDWDEENDPWLSMIIAPDEILERFPKVRMLSGSADPLRDHSIKFCQK